MGSDHDHDDHESIKIPDYRIYKLEDAPELVRIQKALASQGLTDPWARNEVWRYSRKYFGTEKSRMITMFFRGFRVGLIAFVATTVISFAYEKTQPSQDHGKHH